MTIFQPRVAMVARAIQDANGTPASWTKEARAAIREVVGLLGPLARVAAALHDHPDDTVLWQLPDGTDLLLAHVRWTAEFGPEP